MQVTERIGGVGEVSERAATKDRCGGRILEVRIQSGVDVDDFVRSAHDAHSNNGKGEHNAR